VKAVIVVMIKTMINGKASSLELESSGYCKKMLC
jgi:hypothetical protein